jgi:hypothetical protein
VSAPIQQLLLATDLGPVPAFLQRTSGLDATHVSAYTALINGLVADNVWFKLDMLHIYATQDSTTALLNLVSTNYGGVANGSPTFTADRGFTGTDTSNTIFIDTNFNPTTAVSPNFVQNSAHLSGWNLTNAQDARPFMGVSSGSYNTDIFPLFTDGKAYFFCNDNGGGISVANANGTGHYLANRSGSSATQGYKNGSSIVTGSPGSLAPINSNMTTISQHSGAGHLGAGNQMAMASIGSSLSSTDATNFYNRLRTYMTAVGVP